VCSAAKQCIVSSSRVGNGCTHCVGELSSISTDFYPMFGPSIIDNSSLINVNNTETSLCNRIEVLLGPRRYKRSSRDTETPRELIDVNCNLDF
jgi:hypothetical protein